MYHVHAARRDGLDPDGLVPVPEGISLRVAFLPEGLTEAEFRRRAKREIRDFLRAVERGEEDPDDFGLIEEYDAELTKLIREVREEN